MKKISSTPGANDFSQPGSLSDIQKSYDSLRIAVVFEACEDWRKYPEKRKFLEAWLRSPWAQLLMGHIDPEYIIRRLKNEEKQNNETEG